MKVLILGFGRATSGVVEYLRDRGDELYIYEDNHERRKGDGYIFVDRPDIKVDLTVKSPGFPENIIKRYRKYMGVIMDEIEFTYREIGMPEVVAVTGTNGKSTTTSLIGHIVKRKIEKVFVGGNLSPGIPFSKVLKGGRYDLYILELSSFQLKWINSSLKGTGVLLNISMDHLNMHSSWEDYIDSKMKLLHLLKEDSTAVLNFDDKEIMAREGKFHVSKRYFSLISKRDAYIEEGTLIVGNNKIIDTEEVPLPGKHNLYNVMAASLTSYLLGIPPEVIGDSIKDFKGLPHRLEFVREWRGRKFFNNSMCTNPVAFYESLKSFPQKVIAIVGGSEKNLDDSLIIRGIEEFCKYVILMGDSGEKISKILKDRGYSYYIFVDDMYKGVEEAVNVSVEGDIIVLNPGYASFGLFKDFAHRGEVFKEVVNGL